MLHIVVGTASMFFLAMIAAIWKSESSRLRYFPKNNYQWEYLRKDVRDMTTYTVASALFVEAVYWAYLWIVSQWA